MKMENLRRISSIFSLRRKKVAVSVILPGPIQEDAIDENEWPPYDPWAFERSQNM